jgi:hypothetical protein
MNMRKRIAHLCIEGLVSDGECIRKEKHYKALLNWQSENNLTSVLQLLISIVTQPDIGTLINCESSDT